MDKKLKKVIIAFTAIIVVIVAVATINNVSHLNKVLLNIKFAPYEAAVFIDGSNIYTNNSSTYLEIGEHEIMVYLNGFALYEEKIEVTDETKSITGELTPINNYGVQIAQEHVKDSADLDSYITKELEKSWAEKKKTYPILEYIPYTNKAYGIGYKEDGGDFILTITANSPLVDIAVNKLRSFDENISLAEYKFEINNFNNVLAGNFKDNSASDPIEYLKSGYSEINERCVINTGNQQDDYYYTTISVGAYAEIYPITYRAVLKKEGSSWKLVSDPYPLLTITNTPNVPIKVLNAINKLDAPTTTITSNSSGS